MSALKDPRQRFCSFFNTLGPAAHVYTRLVAKTVCVRCTPYIGHPETWAIVAGEITLGALPDRAVGRPRRSSTVVSTRSVIARLHQPLDVFPGEMERTVSDLVKTGRLPMFSPGELLPSTDAHAQEDVDFFRLPELRFLGERLHLIVGDKEDLTAELQASAPYESFDDLMSEMGFGGGRWRDRAEISLAALPIAHIGVDSEITSGIANVKFRLAKNADPKLLRLGWRVLANNGEELIGRDTITGEVTLTKGAGVYEGSIEIPVGAGQAVRCWLNYGGVKQGEPFVICDSRSDNPRYALHELVDPSCRLLAQKVLVLDLQKGQQRDSRAFELGVAHLLHLLGFQAQHYAKPLGNGPDTIAYTQAGDVMVVECSLTSIAGDSSKATWLQERVTLARAKLEAISDGAALPQVLGVAVVAFDDPETAAAEAKELARRGIATICIPALRVYLSRAASSRDTHQAVFDELRNSVQLGLSPLQVGS